MISTLVITNVDLLADDEMFTGDTIGSWNVSRARRDCEAGMHQQYILSVEEAHAANLKVEVDEAKVERYTGMLDVLRRPLIGVVEGNALWLIDGHHRLRALHRLGVTDCRAYVIAEADSGPYQVRYNGSRQPPFKI